MTVPALSPSLFDRVRAAIAWVGSPDGRKDIGAAVAVITAAYTGLHRAGVF